MEVVGVSYIGNPKNNTAMYISKKVGHLIDNLVKCQNCLVFAEKGICIPDDLQKRHCFVFTESPQFEYAQFVTRFAETKQEKDAKRKYTMTAGKYLLGENVSIGVNSYIEPGCLIGHDVIIGANARILAGSVIKNAVIGDDFFCNENAVVGSSSFTMAEDEEGNKFRIPTLGGVRIGNHVEVGAFDNICAGASENTILEDHVKLDALVHVGHEAYLCKNTELVAGTVIGGFTFMGEGSYAGINSGVRNRLTIGSHSIIGMGATVIRDIEDHTTVVGNPARAIR